MGAESGDTRVPAEAVADTMNKITIFDKQHVPVHVGGLPYIRRFAREAKRASVNGSSIFVLLNDQSSFSVPYRSADEAKAAMKRWRNLSQWHK